MIINPRMLARREGDVRVIERLRPGGKRIVIVGCGFAGAYCAQGLHGRLREEDAEIFLVDRHNYFTFYPLLVEAGTGGVEPRHAVISLRAFLRRERFLMAELAEVDFEAGEVICAQPTLGSIYRIPYDHLVLALGSVSNIPDIPGLREHGYELKSLVDAIMLRDRAVEMLELAAECDDAARRSSLLHFVIVGGNFTGAEVAGELEDLMREAVQRYPGLDREDVRITLVDRGRRILSELDLRLSRYAMENLRQRGVHIRLRDTVVEVGARHARFQNGETVSTETVIWTAGIAPPPVVSQLKVPVDERGYILCERDLRVRGFENVWAIGDAAVNIDGRGRPYPATAQHAVRQGAACARNIVRVLRGKAAQPCDIRSRGTLAALGRRTGVAEVFGLRFSGFVAWWLWRTVYLFKMPGVGRKVRVVLEWTVELFSRRDHVQLGIRREAGREESDAGQPPVRSVRHTEKAHEHRDA
jgi:NADH:ubiquinone reductase (H+-translocating)